jgi:hypothetical protein
MLPDNRHSLLSALQTIPQIRLIVSDHGRTRGNGVLLKVGATTPCLQRHPSASFPPSLIVRLSVFRVYLSSPRHPDLAGTSA